MGRSKKHNQNQPTPEQSPTKSDDMLTSQDEPHASNPPLTLADMEKLLKAMEDRIITKLSDQLSADHATIERHDQAIQSMETSLNDMETRLTTLESTCLALSKENQSLRLKTDDLENRSRRNNIRITGVPERAEGGQPTAFMEALLKETFGAHSFSTPPTVDRAHRIAVPRKKQDDPPRPFIARIHHYQTKERILRLAREKGALSFRGADIHIYPDYSAEVARNRAAYFAVKSQLRNAGLAYRMLFPAKLQVTDKNGQRLVFSSPDEVSSYLHDNPPGSTSTPAGS